MRHQGRRGWGGERYWAVWLLILIRVRCTVAFLPIAAVEVHASQITFEVNDVLVSHRSRPS
jgi:hypothetical protein